MLEFLSAKSTKSTLTLTALHRKKLPEWLSEQNAKVRRWVQSGRFKAGGGEVCLLPASDGGVSGVLVGVEKPESPWSYSALPARLPKGRYRFDGTLSPRHADAAALGWALGCYRFDRYKKPRGSRATLVWPEAARVEHATALIEGIGLTRDLINTPAEDMGPEELTAAGSELAKRHGGKTKILRGQKQLQAFPAVYAVGRAAANQPQLLDLTWGNASHPKVTLVGKGVVFDSGGLDLKPAASMKLMKKDMGGAALMLGLAHAIMALQLPVRLRLLVPAVENAIGGNAMRPLDVLQTRKGLTVEVGNTDAEGRLILSDALTAADEERPDVIVDAATLTGAARVALGTALPALFCNDDALANQILDAGLAVEDPLWRLPLHAPYARYLESPVADLNNIGTSGYGGAITAALFLSRFVRPKTRWAHVDTMGWNVDSLPGRPVGGEALALRALVEALTRRYAAA